VYQLECFHRMFANHSLLPNRAITLGKDWIRAVYGPDLRVVVDRYNIRQVLPFRVKVDVLFPYLPCSNYYGRNNEFLLRVSNKAVKLQKSCVPIMHGYFIDKLPEQPIHWSTAVPLLRHDDYAFQISVERLNSSICVLSCMQYVSKQYTPHVNFASLVLVHVLQKLLRSGLLTSNSIKLL
jgi:hypothetical protein